MRGNPTESKPLGQTLNVLGDVIPNLGEVIAIIQLLCSDSLSLVTDTLIVNEDNDNFA